MLIDTAEKGVVSMNVVQRIRNFDTTNEPLYIVAHDDGAFTEIAELHEQIRILQQENQKVIAENQRLKKALDMKNTNLFRNL